ncbi:MAG: Dabb family protein [Bacteroidales bacterium]|nr:Dabb family protein [Bacteroidales bacterium]
MQRRFFVKSFGLLVAIGSFPFLKLKAVDTDKKITFRHVVYFWLNEPEDSTQRKQFLKNLKEFINGMDNIEDVFIGTAASTKREVVENSYQFSLNLGFKNRQEHDIYQDHPLHKLFIEKSAHMWKRVLVYDSDLV